jgi:hypothetical protein
MDKEPDTDEPKKPKMQGSGVGDNDDPFLDWMVIGVIALAFVIYALFFT